MWVAWLAMLHHKPATSVAGYLRADDLDLLRGRHRHMEPRARDALDESVGGPCALLELQLAPLDLQIVAPRVQSLELDEERARAMLAVDRSGGGAERRQPQQRHGNRERPAGAHASSYATQSRALRARGFRSSSAAVGRVLRPLSFKRVRAAAGNSGRRLSRGSPRDSRCMKRFTARSSRE